MKEDVETLILDIRQYLQGLVNALEDDKYDDILRYTRKMQNRLRQ